MSRAPAAQEVTRRRDRMVGSGFEERCWPHGGESQYGVSKPECLNEYKDCELPRNALMTSAVVFLTASDGRPQSVTGACFFSVRVAG